MKLLRFLIAFGIGTSPSSCSEDQLLGTWQCIEIIDAINNGGPFAELADINICAGTITFTKSNTLIAEGEVDGLKSENYFKYNKHGHHLKVGENEDYRVLKLTRDTLIIMDTILDGQLKFVDRRKRVYERIN